jgi:hypothetical protein
MRKHIRITNPLEGLGFTSKQRAKRYVASGVADWVTFGVAIRFLRENHQTASVQRSIDATLAGYMLATVTGMANHKALKHTPVLMPERLLTDVSRTPHRAPRSRRGPVRIVMEAGVYA